MKKLFVLLCACASFVGHAQSKFGIHAGAISANIKETYDGDSEIDFKSKISFRAGVHASFPLSSNVSIMPQLNYVSKGTRIDESESTDMFGFPYSITVKGNYTMNYLELPVHFVYNQPMAKGNSFFIGIGPSFSYGLSGNAKVDITENDNGVIYEESESIDIKFDGKDNATANDNYGHYKAFEFGLSMIAGYHFTPNFFVNLNFNQGLSNINPDETDKGETKTSYFGLGIGYYFSK
jgi:hypothetical protein